MTAAAFVYVTAGLLGRLGLETPVAILQSWALTCSIYKEGQEACGFGFGAPMIWLRPDHFDRIGIFIAHSGSNRAAEGPNLSRFGVSTRSCSSWIKYELYSPILPRRSISRME